MNKILYVKGVSKRFGAKPALEEVTFSLEAGRVLGLLGPNGAGKTTLMKIITRLYHQNGGEVFICGEPGGWAVKRHVSYMPDSSHLFRWMSVGQAVGYYADMFPDFNREKAGALCDLLEVNMKEPTRRLSRGTLERVLIMLTFAREASLYLLDEPIAAIDPLGREKILKTILAGINENSGVLLSTHLVKDVETVLDDVLILNRGRLLLNAPAEEIRAEHGRSIDEHYLEVLKHA